ncbi:MAG: DUF1015 domain-containing protein [Bryobacterales bacterium]|nr:DUF1015 domain-containing protein [Bryobacterales bacterium]
MAKIYPFQAYRYTGQAGDPATLVTQPYDKIYPEMQARYLAASPYNLVRVILGERFPDDTAENNVYTRAAAYLNQWTAGGILEREDKPSLYAYFQRFRDPDTGEELTRKGLICAGRVEEYAAGIVHRHEQTLSGPKQDRRELLRHTEAHFGQIFLLYPDEEGGVDAILDQAAAGDPLLRVDDGYGALHLVWRVDEPSVIARIQALMDDKKLVIADGHHRYETALAYSKASPKADAQRVMMTLVNMHSPGLRILATHRMVHSLARFDAAALVSSLRALGRLASFPGATELKAALREVEPGRVRVGIALPGAFHALDVERTAGMLDVNFLHEQVLSRALGITEEDVREQKYLHYVRGLDTALEQVRAGQCQVAFLLQPTTVRQVAEISFGGGVMPQKSTDFFPKLLSGVTIYKLER